MIQRFDLILSQKKRLVLSKKYSAAQLISTLKKIIILEWFLKGHVTLNTGVMLMKIQLYIMWINYILKYINQQKMLLLNSKHILQYYSFYCF